MTVALALVASLVFGTSDFIGGTASRQAAPLRVAALGQMVALALTVPLALLVSWQQVTGTDAAWSLASGVAAACGLALFYSAMARGLISIVVPITAVIGALLPVAYALARGERPTTVALVGIVLALIAVAIVSAVTGDRQEPMSAAVISSSIAAGTFFGAFIILLSRASEHAGLWPIALSRSTSALALAAFALILTGTKPDDISRLLPACTAIGVLETGGMVALLLALQRGPIAIASVLLSLYPVTTVMLAVLLLGEHLSRLQLTGIVLALSSVILISAQ
jgi:drug/metabolite transporter (DMT)-like permease